MRRADLSTRGVLLFVECLAPPCGCEAPMMVRGPWSARGCWVGGKNWNILYCQSDGRGNGRMEEIA